MNRVGSFLHAAVFFDFGSQSTKWSFADVKAKQVANYLLFDRSSKQVIAIGREARALAHAKQNELILSQPIVEGTVSSIEDLKLFVEAILAREQAKRKNFFSQYALYYSRSPLATAVEARAFEQSLKQVSSVSIVRPKDFSKNLHKQLYGNDKSLHFSLILGAEITYCLLTRGVQVLNCQRFFWGGHKLEKKIEIFLRDELKLIVDKAQLVQLLSEINMHASGKKKTVLTLRGKDTVSLQPKTSRLELQLIVESLETELKTLIKLVQRNLTVLSSEELQIMDENGIVITGGLAQLSGLDKYLSQALSLPVAISKRPVFDELESIKGAA